MLDRSTPNLFDCNPPSASAEAERPTVELERPVEPDRVARAAPSTASRPRRSARAFSQVREGLFHRLPSRLPRATRYVPVGVALLLLASHVFSAGHAKLAPAALAATQHTTIADAAVPAARPRATRAPSPQTAQRPAHVHKSRTARAPVALTPDPNRARRRLVSSRAQSVSASPPPAPTTPASAPPAPPPTPVPPPATAPAPAAPAPRPSGEHTSEFGFEQ